MFCIVLHDSITHIHNDYINKLSALCINTKKVNINFVNIDDNSNQWYYKILRPQILPVTCIFNESGKLIDIIPGNSIESMRYIANTIKTSKINPEFHFNQKYDFEKIQLIKYFDSIFKLHYAENDNENISYAIDSLLNISLHPYLIYMRMKHSQLMGEDYEAYNSACEFLATYNASDNIVLYHDEYIEANTYIDSNYFIKAPIIDITHDLVEINYKPGEITCFNIPIKNIGLNPLRIYNIILGCGCIELIGEKSSYIESGQSTFFTFKIKPTPNELGYRDIFIVSNAINGPTTRISIKTNLN